ncbi:Sec-independent protein translocase protein TatC [Gemmata sp. SH-PL17]|uniref:twin-arginine translocase subunit TatC n=1 Tax=Gemmata sp. SH-PL17 TaxID=1630693 RepID=UPI0004BB778E|nr:twin-arginine translocase subunit TatC [Gemmata sp. SH-PL17]AMV27196.1 Sec-independent protein translocase protein TatC [Gemmata sp. SH-PL17]
MPTKAIQTLAKKYDEYPDDMFKDTRMSLGEHIEELRYRMLNALKWLLFFLVIGFVLDFVGKSVGNDNIGIGMPMLDVITEPVKQQTRDFYFRAAKKSADEKLAQLTDSTPEEIARVRQKLEENEYNLSALTAEERRKLLGAPEEMPVFIPVKALTPAFGAPKADAPEELPVKLKVYPAHISNLSSKGEGLMESKKYLTTLSAQESMVVYFKVSLLCGVVIACPFILYQFWAFVGAGLYPHEKRYAYLFFGPSVFLFIAGVVLCQFVVLPGAVKALLKFNEILGFDPDIRLNEWLSLAIILPLVFGVSFQTPLVMVFLNRIGIFTAEDYLTKWRYACIIIAFFAAIITPTPDVITMLYLFVPMFGLYMVGILICHQFPGFDPSEDTDSEAADEVAV